MSTPSSHDGRACKASAALKIWAAKRKRALTGKIASLKIWAAKRKRALTGKIASMTTGRILAFVYTVAMLGVAWFLPWHGDASYVRAVRYLGVNTRMVRPLWTEPSDQAGRLELARL
jgi:hypothetical protein